jgi:hypothetical protein
MTTFYGGFRADKYTEQYSAHAEFSAWPIILTMLLEWMLLPITGNTQTATDPATGWHTHSVVTSGGGGHTTSCSTHGHNIKESAGPKYLMALATWLLGWLLNGRNIKTTMQKGFKYYLGYQQLLCWSADNMRIRSLYMEKYNSSTKRTTEGPVWSGDESREAHCPDPFTIHVDDDDLFGGPDEGGGFIGDIRIYLGGKNQNPDSWMKEQLSAESVQEELRGLVPAYRPFVTTVVPTAYIGKSATIPKMWYEVQCIPNRLGLGAIGEDCNPAEVLYEIHVNKKWGLGQSDDVLDKDALIKIGQTLKNEGLGITVVIKDKGAARAVVDTICEHLDIVRYQDPKLGG